MLDQNVTTILSTLLGGTLAITGGFLATGFSQRAAEKAEKRKIARERADELYLLSNQLQEWIKVQILRSCEIEEVTLIRNIPRWFFDAINTEPECPIERMNMLVHLYVSSVVKEFIVYRNSVVAVQKLEVVMRNNHFTKYNLEEHCKSSLENTTDADVKERLDKGSNIVVEYMVQLLVNFEESQEKLLRALQVAVR